MVATSVGGLGVERLTGSIGAVLHGLDLTVPLAAGDVEHLRDLVAEHQVVFAHDQHLDEEQHRTVANRFGELSIWASTTSTPRRTTARGGRRSSSAKRCASSAPRP